MASGEDTCNLGDGAVLGYINKRLRSLRKKLNRIAKLEYSIAQGESIIKNKEQEELLKSKPTIIALVKELEKSREPLSVAVDRDITVALRRRHRHRDSDEDSDRAQKALDEDEERLALPMDDLLSLIYFGSMFNPEPVDMKTRWDERCWCLLHDTFQHDHGVILGEEELNAISMLSSLMISRPEDCSLVSHQDALQRCIEHAKHWISKSKKKIDPSSEFTYADVREMLKKVMGLDYFNNTPLPGKRKYHVLPLHVMGTFLTYEKEEDGVRRQSGYSECCSDDDYGCCYRDVDGFSGPDTE